MIKGLLGIFTLAILFGSCTKQDKIVKIQLLRIGTPYCGGSNKLNKGFGANYYIDYNVGQDSLLLYTCGLNPETGDIEPERISKVKIDNELTVLLNSVYIASDTTESGVLSSINNEEGSKIYCGGTHILTVSDGSTHKYYSFVHRNSCAFEHLVNYFEANKMNHNSTKKGVNAISLNIDSIIGYMVSSPKIKGKLVLPPLKSTVKFTPPKINENE